MKVPRFAWLIWIGAFAVLEGLALANGVRGDTLTEYMLSAVPGAIIYSFLGWLLWHFREAR